MKKTEIPAFGVKGFILQNFYTKDVFFRVYNEDKTFVDYDLAHNDLEVTIIDESASLYRMENKPEGVIDYTSKILGRNNVS